MNKWEDKYKRIINLINIICKIKIYYNFIYRLDLDLPAFFSYINHGSSEDHITVNKLNQFIRDHGVLFQDEQV